ncbi:sugar phosphate isomerase/epimerase [Mycobacterium sp. SMC-4]|uniref:sugar phosphate isomerase/epimerase family protein n=1 Tax=Mycobacterium sp. SMC-4 TaxID=2857059 RepID=UPI0021B2A0BB|nr:sugar phosphate isomerase/epimerase [Mycobacterium sp. SMC-4]UXA16590.1 sugar phosphate isomerase/epimerase [Mycobacterium sp. SMC-4]
MSIDARLSVHDVTFLGDGPAELAACWESLGVSRLSLIDTELSDPALARAIHAGQFSVETVYHLFGSSDGLFRVIDAAAGIGTRVVYMLTGGRSDLTWEQAADRFCDAVRPCIDHARAAGVALAIENASSLYADIHIAHTLADTVELAERAGIGVCIDLFHCWVEADLAGLLERAMPRLEMIQLSDYVLGDRCLPARAVPGDGAIPIEPLVAQVLAQGYAHGFDLELIGPRIEAEGRLAAARRACDVASAMLQRISESDDVTR